MAVHESRSEVKVLDDIRVPQKGSFNKDETIEWLYCVLLGKNDNTQKNGYSTYTGVVIYKIKNLNDSQDIRYEIKRDILIGIQSTHIKGLIVDNKIKPSEMRAQVKIQGTTMYCLILNKAIKKEIEADKIYDYSYELPTLNKSGAIVQFGKETDKGQAVVINIGYFGYINYANGKIKALVAQSRYGIKRPSLIDVVNDTVHRYVQLDESMVINLRSLGILAMQDKSNYFTIEKASNIIRSSIQKLNLLNRVDQNNQVLNFALVLDKYVATREYDLMIFQSRHYLHGADPLTSRYLSIAVMPINDDWKLENIFNELVQYQKYYIDYAIKMLNKQRGSDISFYSALGALNYVRVSHLTILGVDTISVYNTLGFEENDSCLIDNLPVIVSNIFWNKTHIKMHRYRFRNAQYASRRIQDDRLTIHIPDIKKIQKMAFKVFGLYSISDYNNLEIISQRAFEYSDLHKIEIGPKVTKIGQHAYADQAVCMDYLEIPENVRFIGGSAFKGTNIKVIKIMNPNIEMQQKVFQGWMGDKLIIPKKLKYSPFIRGLQNHKTIETY